MAGASGREEEGEEKSRPTPHGDVGGSEQDCQGDYRTSLRCGSDRGLLPSTLDHSRSLAIRLLPVSALQIKIGVIKAGPGGFLDPRIQRGKTLRLEVTLQGTAKCNFYSWPARNRRQLTGICEQVRTSCRTRTGPLLNTSSLRRNTSSLTVTKSFWEVPLIEQLCISAHVQTTELSNIPFVWHHMYPGLSTFPRH